jgi:hypothetical protein
VSRWTEIFLGIIALATLATAVVQIAVLVAAGRLARRVDRLVDQAERELRPLFDQLHAIARDAARAASLATAQVERADRVFADLAHRIDETLATVQGVIAKPAREGAAMLSALRAAINALRDLRAGRSRKRAEDEDALFI